MKPIEKIELGLGDPIILNDWLSKLNEVIDRLNELDRKLDPPSVKKPDPDDEHCDHEWQVFRDNFGTYEVCKRCGIKRRK